jgi:hypothetical protein
MKHRSLFTTPFYNTAAFTMVFVLGSFIYSSIGSAKEIAANQKAKNYERALEQRKHLGMDVWDQKAERERLRKEKGWASNAPPGTETMPTEKEV